MNTNTKELDLNKLENISGGAERESAPNNNGNFISWIIDLLFGD